MIEVFIYLFTVFALIFFKKFYKRFVTSFTIIIFPYIIILLLNNHIANNFSFYLINENTQLMILIGIVCFFVGSLAFIVLFQNKGISALGDKNFKIIDTIEVKRIVPYVKIVLLIRILQLLYLYLKYNLSGLMANDFELLLTRGIVAHLLVSIFPLIILLFAKWMEDKSHKEYLILYLIFMILAFIETEKTQVLSLIVATFLYLMIKNEKMLIKGIILIVTLVAILFIGNYVIKLTLQGYASGVEGVYYTYRLWNYIAGGIINSNYITSNPNMVSTNALTYLINCILAFPNMFINKFVGFSIGTEVYSLLPYIQNFPAVTNAVGYRHQTGNVVSTMTMMYGNGNLLLFIPVCTLWGALSEFFYIKMKTDRKDINLMSCVCYMTFSFFSFFASYYTLASFYERIILCLIIGYIMNKRVKFRIRRSVL